MEVLVRGSCDDVVVVGHENDVVDEKFIFINGFGQDREENLRKFLFHEAEGLVVGAADQVIGIFGLEDTGFACHDLELAGSVPKGSDPGGWRLRFRNFKLPHKKSRITRLRWSYGEAS